MFAVEKKKIRSSVHHRRQTLGVNTILPQAPAMTHSTPLSLPPCGGSTTPNEGGMGGGPWRLPAFPVGCSLSTTARLARRPPAPST